MNMWHVLTEGAEIPKRETEGSAGYDLRILEDVVLEPGEKKLAFTGVALQLGQGLVGELHVRSSIGVKKGLMLSNGTGIIDSDYYGNPKNGGNIGIPLWNYSEEKVTLKAGERVAQLIIKPFLKVRNDEVVNSERKGGIGSTGVK